MTIKIIFICTGNICRSPTGEAIARKKARDFGILQNFEFDSAGISSYHQGENPNQKAVLVGKKHGVSFEGIKARKIKESDLENFDYLFCMDNSHYDYLMQMASPNQQEKIHLLLKFGASKNDWDDEVIDPYYGAKSYEDVFAAIDRAVDRMFEVIK